MTYYIYGLVCPMDFKIKYVGQTFDLKARLSVHMSNPNKLMREWMNELKSKSLKPSIVILDIPKSNIAATEIEWINKLEATIGNLFNERENNVRAIKMGFKDYNDLHRNKLLLTRIKNGFSKQEKHTNLIK